MAAGVPRVPEAVRPEDVPDPQDPATFAVSRLDWSEPSYGDHARLLAWYRDLVRLRREREALRDPRLDEVRTDHHSGLFVLHRGDHQVLVNLSAEPVRADARGRVLLSWEPGVEVDRGAVEVPVRSAVVVGP